MKCGDINGLLTAYLDGEVTSEERRQIESHLPTCEKCLEDLRLLASTREGLRQALIIRAAGVEPSPQAWDRVRQRIESKITLWDQLGGILSKPVWRAAIPVVLVLIVIGALWRAGVLPGLQSSQAPVAAPSLTVPAPAAVPRPASAPAPAPTTAVPPPAIAVPAPTPTPASSDLTSNRVEVKPGDNTVIMSALMGRLSLDDLVRKSDAIVIGKVTQILPSRQSESVGRSIIYTDVLIHTERYLYGKPQSDSLAVQVWGGRIGNNVMVVEDMPVFNLGEEVVLFLQRLPPGNTPPSGIEPADYYTVYGSMQGKYAYSNGTVADLQGNRFSVSDIEQKIATVR